MTVNCILFYVCMLYVWIFWGLFLMVPVSGYCVNSKNDNGGYLQISNKLMLDQLGTLAKLYLLSLCGNNRNDDDDNDEIKLYAW